MATTTDFGAALTAAAQGSGYIAQLAGGTYTVTQPIVIYLSSNIQGIGINGGGATVISKVPAGQPVIEFILGPGVDLRYLDLSNFTIQGNGSEGDGIKVVADGNDRGAYNWNFDNVTVNHVGGYGLHLLGNVFEGLVSNSWMNNNGKGGALFEHNADNSGQVSALRWFGGGAQNNNGPGITLGNGGRDLSVDGANFTANHGAGISAPWALTSVTGSTFVDNQGTGIEFNNFGNFNNNTFSTTGVQTTGISGYLTGDTTLLNNVSHYTGTGADPTSLANLTGNAHDLEIGNTGRIVKGPGVIQGTTGGDNHASVQVSTQGVSAPALVPVTTATTAPAADSNGSGALETALKAALNGGTVAHLTATNYTIKSPIIINITHSTQGPIGIDLGGAKISSQVTGGAPLIEIIVGSGVNVGTLTLSNFTINGSYSEGDGIKIVANGTDRSIDKLQLNNVNVEWVGGVGLDVLGNVKHATVVDSWMHGDGQGGARFAAGPAGGVPSDLQWIGGGFRKNSIAGLILDNGAHDMTVKGAYFVENVGVGIHATSGITLVQASGFENNGGAAVVVDGAGGNFTDDTFSTYGPQTVAVAGRLSGGQISLTGTDAEYYGAGSDPTVVANVQGTGTINMAGGGKLVTGPSVVVKGASPVLAGTATVPTTTPAPVTPPPPPSTPAPDTAPTVTAKLTNDTGASSTDKITSSPALAGTADANAVIHFTIDGTAVAATATANASGAWSFTPTGLANGQHTIVASETKAGGATGSATLTFVLDSQAPTTVLDSAVVTNGQVTLAGHTGAAGDTVHVYDGNSWLGAVKTASDGTFSFGASAPANVTHTYGAFAVDLAGNVGLGSNHIAPGTSTGGSTATTPPSSPSPASSAPSISVSLANDTGASASDGITHDPALKGTADPGAVVHLTVDGVAVAATATANASGAWSLTPTGLGDGQHTIMASETSAAGATAAAFLTFMLDAQAPIPTLTGVTVANGQATLAGTTGEAGNQVHLYDGDTWMGMTLTGSDGTWHLAVNAASSAVHTYGVFSADAALHIRTSPNKLVLGSTAADTLAGGAGGDVIVGNGGNDTITGGRGADTLTGGPGKVTFAYNGVADSTPGAADTITDFRPGSDKIDLTAIAGINAANGTPLFQGNITGSGNLTLNAHSVAYIEVGSTTQVLVNTSNAAETVSTSDMHAADMKIGLLGVHLGLTAADFHHA